MKLKRFALRALATLAVVVALCMFFSGTVRTMTTPKVKLVSTKEGKLEQTAQLTAKLVFPESEEIRLREAMEATVVVEKVHVRAGYEVKEGDVIFTASVTDFEEKMQKLQSDYAEKAAKLNDLERQNSQRTRTTTRNRLYSELTDALETLHEREIAMRVALGKENIVLAPETDWLAEAQSQGGSEEALAAVQACLDAQAAADQAQAAFSATDKDYKLAVTDETWKYIIERDQLIEDMEALDQQMVDLTLMRDRLMTVCAPRDGYITEVKVKVGENYDGKGAAYAMSAADSTPVLRADLSEVQMTVDEGAKVTIKQNYWEMETAVSAVGLDSEGKKYADIALTDELIAERGGVYGLTLTTTAAEISTRARSATTLIPASAVRSEGEGNDYVYRIDRKYGSFTGENMYVTKTLVTVLGRSDKLVSVAEEMYGVQLADKEDRAISDGMVVMEYVN